MNQPIPPRTDDDTFAVLDDAITALAARRGLWLSEHNMIHLLASLIDQALRTLPGEISTAVDNGTSWDEIATLIGTSPEQARLRYAPDSPIADGRWPWPIDPR